MEQNKPEYHVVSLSGGKDSTAMLLMMLERGMQIDCILFCDTGLTKKLRSYFKTMLLLVTMIWNGNM